MRRQFPPAPTHANALVLTAHPYPDSFCHALADAWIEGASLPTERIEAHDLAFEPRLRVAHRADQPLEPDLERVRDAMTRAAHLVVVTPTWWSSTPAALKGLFDRVLLPGWAFRYERGLPVGGLRGRSARLLLTMDAPVWYDRLLNGAATRRQIVRGTLKFCGFSPARATTFGSVGDSSPASRQRMLRRAQRAGVQDARRVRRALPMSLPAGGALGHLAE